MHTISMIINYDGSRYFGWQRQTHLISVQEVLEKSLSKVLHQTITIDGSGRTDAGVHALGQCASFNADLTIPIEKLKYVLNRILPSDIFIEKMQIEVDGFHARYHAIGKTYIYKIFTGKDRNPFLDKYSYHYAYPLNLELINRAMLSFIGEHDFKAYMASGSKTQNSIRTIYDFKLEVASEMLIFTITGDGFLYNMVRIIIGSLLHVGTGKIKPEAITDIINSGSRDRAKFIVPSSGLYLKSVFYSKELLQIQLKKND